MVLDYKLKYNPLGQKRKYALTKKKRKQIEDTSTWVENDLKNQWYFKDYKSYYITISMYKPKEYTVTCSGYKIKTIFKDLERAKLASTKFCDKIYR